MSRKIGISRKLQAPILALLLLLVVSPVPAGRGNLGSPMILTGSKVEVTIGSSVFTHQIIPGQSNTAVRAALEALINDPNSPFNATDSTDPFDPNGVVFEVLPDSGGELHDLQICETSASLTQLATYIPMGKDVALIDLPTALNGDPNGYTLVLRLWDSAPFIKTYNTAIAPNNTPAGLVSSLKTDLTAAGFNVIEGSTFLSISKTRDMLTYVKIVALDTGIVNTCTRLVPSTGTGVPTLSQYGFFALVLLMTVAALLMLRRKSSESGAASRY